MFYFKQSLFRTVIFIAWFRENYTYGSDNIQFIYACAFWLSVILTLLTYDYGYWTYIGMFSPPAWPVVGHIWKMAAFKEHSGLFFKKIYDTYKSKRFIGIHQFYRRTVVVCEPELIRRMCVNDFQHFTDRGFSFDRQLDPLAESVLYLRGNQWKALRSKISPIFSPIKLKGMLPLVDNTAVEFISRVKRLIKETKTDIDEYKLVDIGKQNGGKNVQDEQDGRKIVKMADIGKEKGVQSVQVKQDGGKIVSCSQLFGGYTADAIVPCAFGVKSHVMENPEDPFAVALRAYYEFTFRNVLEKSLHYFWPAFAMFMKIRIIPKKTHEFFYNIVSNVIRERQNGVHEKRGDFLDMMMALQSDERNHNSQDKDDVKITDMVISANAFIIFLGGYETTSSTLSFLLLEVAEHPGVQERMRTEIREVLGRHGGVITYEMLQDLTYMEMVIMETLRLYPPFPAIQRQCKRAYTLPHAHSDTYAHARTHTASDVVIEPDTLVIFPTLGLHRDEQYFENATSFIPERWAEDQPPPPPGVYMPFGEGPRYCIGKRFAMIQMKCCLVKLLQHVKVCPAPKLESCAQFSSESCAQSTPESCAESKIESFAQSSTESPELNSESGVTSGGPEANIRKPFAADLRCPMTLHPADSRVRLTLL